MSFAEKLAKARGIVQNTNNFTSLSSSSSNTSTANLNFISDKNQKAKDYESEIEDDYKPNYVKRLKNGKNDLKHLSKHSSSTSSKSKSTSNNGYDSEEIHERTAHNLDDDESRSEEDGEGSDLEGFIVSDSNDDDDCQEEDAEENVILLLSDNDNEEEEDAEEEDYEDLGECTTEGEGSGDEWEKDNHSSGDSDESEDALDDLELLEESFNPPYPASVKDPKDWTLYHVVEFIVDSCLNHYAITTLGIRLVKTPQSIPELRKKSRAISEESRWSTEPAVRAYQVWHNTLVGPYLDTIHQEFPQMGDFLHDLVYSENFNIVELMSPAVCFLSNRTTSLSVDFIFADKTVKAYPIHEQYLTWIKHIVYPVHLEDNILEDLKTEFEFCPVRLRNNDLKYQYIVRIIGIITWRIVHFVFPLLKEAGILKQKYTSITSQKK